MAAPSKTIPHPGRALIALGVLIVIMLLGVLSGNLSSPGQWHKDARVGLGLDLSGGTQVTMRATTPTGGKPSSAEMNQAISVILARVNGTGNSGAKVQTEGATDLAVSVPGPPNPQTEALVTTTAVLTFRQVLLEQAKGSAVAGNASLVNRATLKLFDRLVCTPGNQATWKTQVGYTRSSDYDNPTTQVVACDASGRKFAQDQAVVPRDQFGRGGPQLAATAAMMACGSGSIEAPATKTVGVPPTPRSTARSVTYEGQSR